MNKFKEKLEGFLLPLLIGCLIVLTSTGIIGTVVMYGSLNRVEGKLEQVVDNLNQLSQSFMAHLLKE